MIVLKNARIYFLYNPESGAIYFTYLPLVLAY